MFISQKNVSASHRAEETKRQKELISRRSQKAAERVKKKRENWPL
jgi:hypothetical protein